MRRATIRPPLAAAVAGLVLAVLAAVVPPAAMPVAPFLSAFDAQPAFAADDLAVTSAARYVVVPDKAVVRVTVDLTTVNRKPNKVSGGVVTRYFYDGVNVGVQPEGRRFHATQGGAPLQVTTQRRQGYRLVTIHFRGNLYFQEKATVRLTFDLPAGRPRSASDVRVGPAFASFLAWAFGDAGTVRIDIPAAFEVTVSGATMEESTGAGGAHVYRASTTDSIAWYAWINASNTDGLTRQRLALPGGDVIIVRAWPEDTRWRSRVTSILREGVPELADRIGLPWPVTGSLGVFEVHTPLLEGYAGFYDRAKAEITISEELDDVTIVHEASHAWFNGGLFSERWITEGLAEEYAAQVVNAMGGDAPAPKKVKRTAKAAFALNAWPPPAPIASDVEDARERYGYDASYSLIHQVAKDAGADGMRKVFAAASAGTTAYTGDLAPERTTLPDDWRRFLDLTEQLGGATGVAALLEHWALPAGAGTDLQARETARAAYDRLAAAGDGWAAPVVVRLAMDGWAFDRARTGIEAATGVLAERDRIDAQAATQGLEPPAGLEAAYEGATAADGLDAAATLASSMETSLAQVADAAEAAAAPRDWLVQLGLTGKDPDADLAAARASWEAGDLAGAKDAAILVSGTLAVAGDAGRGRVLVFGGSIGLALILLIAAILLLRRRSRRRAHARLAAAAAADASALAVDDAPWIATEALRPPVAPGDAGPDPYLDTDTEPVTPPPLEVDR